MLLEYDSPSVLISRFAHIIPTPYCSIKSHKRNHTNTPLLEWSVIAQRSTFQRPPFHLQEFAFHLDAERIAADVVLPDDAVAGDEKGYGVLRKGGADGAIRARADGLGNFRIGSAFAVGNGARHVPHGALKFRSEGTDGKRKRASLAREIRADLFVGAFFEGRSLVRAWAG